MSITRPARLRADQPSPMDLPCAAPLAGTRPAYAEHQRAASHWSCHSTPGSGSEIPSLVVLLLGVTHSANNDSPFVWQITDVAGHVLHPDAWDTGGSGAESWVTWSCRVPAGSYRLEWRSGVLTLALALWVERDWTTVAFVPAGRRGLDPVHAAIHTIPWGTAWDPNDEMTLAQEIVLSGLRQNHCLVSGEMVERLLIDAFNPFQALVCARALQAPEPAESARERRRQFQAITEELVRRMPGHPDVRVLRTELGGRRRQSTISMPPLMAVSCLHLLARDAERDADKQSPLVPGSAAEYATSRLASAGVWTTWLRPTSPPHRDPPVPVDKTVAFLRQAASVNDLTVEQVIERLGEQEICRRARVPRRFAVQAVERLRSPRVSVYEAALATARPGRRVRIEGDPPTRDATVNRAYSALGDTYDFFLTAFGRDSLDGEGLPLVAVVHSGETYNNAFWDGEQMIYGDGDGEVFQDFTIPMDVTAHELTHGVVQYTANLSFYDQPGALHESICDVFGSLVKQYSLGQTAGEADWLIGAGLFTPA